MAQLSQLSSNYYPGAISLSTMHDDTRRAEAQKAATEAQKVVEAQKAVATAAQKAVATAVLRWSPKIRP
jgi:hypothetical protein